MRLVTMAALCCGQYTNDVYSRVGKPRSRLFYVTESGDWSIKWDARYITENLKNQNLLNARMTLTHRGIHNQILHFGSRNLFLPHAWENVDTSNKIIFTWYHGTERDRNPVDLAMIEALPEASKRADMVHTACVLSGKKLIEWGCRKKKS